MALIPTRRLIQRSTRFDAVPQGPRVLFVDGEPALCDLTVAVLEALGHPCEAFSDPGSALGWLGARPGRVDLVLAGADPEGLAFAADVARLRGDLPVILCVAPGIEPTLPLPANVAGLLPLPLDGTGLGPALRAALAQARPARPDYGFPPLRREA
ncbi:DNA-binding transcriptional response regulator [Mesoterricola sediminis]|uniref:Response regulatory domain-containing protein n=1 Tax=Mesoterricola sediminis TaxID=2927980 RepID=A0AA48GSM8_9BACT|nr:hypothetical protein [Mesoterricola sediminis]BDU76857.1 hypothetical protein METESE_18150 [Mesoterricola sediminis]